MGRFLPGSSTRKGRTTKPLTDSCLFPFSLQLDQSAEWSLPSREHQINGRDDKRWMDLCLVTVSNLFPFLFVAWSISGVGPSQPRIFPERAGRQNTESLWTVRHQYGSSVRCRPRHGENRDEGHGGLRNQIGKCMFSSKLYQLYTYLHIFIHMQLAYMFFFHRVLKKKKTDCRMQHL